MPSVKLDPWFPLTIDSRSISIPEPSFKLTTLLEARKTEFLEEDYDSEDQAIFSAQESSIKTVLSPQAVREDDWKHDPDWVQECVAHMMPAPSDATPMATSALQRELTSMLKEQEKAKSLKELGWFMPPDLIGDNLFQWVVELHSFEPDLPVAKDLATRYGSLSSSVIHLKADSFSEYSNVNSLVFEIRFPQSYPHSPPFFRILKPRFLPFIQGGGGHVTGGASSTYVICFTFN